MTAIGNFDDAMDRAEHPLDLYELLHNTRARSVRNDWAQGFKEFMGWSPSEEIVRVDGNDAILIIRDRGRGWHMSHFDAPWLSELLRAALTAGVSAFDRYVHDLYTDHFSKFLASGSPDKYHVTVRAAERAIAKALESRTGGKKTRPRQVLKERFRSEINSQTFQGSKQVTEALSKLGLKKFWKRIANGLDMTTDTLHERLDKIVRRRNQIVHEGDIKHGSKKQSVQLNKITSVGVREDLAWIRLLVSEIEREVELQL